MAYTITIEEVLNGITVTPPAANEVTVSTTNYPITISYNAVQIDGEPGEGVPTGGTTGQVLSKASNTDYDTEWVTLTDLIGLENIVEDTTPQLGGNLDVNGNKIVSTANGNIVIEPNGTGDIELKADTVTYGDGGVYSYVTSTSGSILHFSASGATNLSGNYFSVDDSSGTFVFQSTGSGTKMLFISDGLRLGKSGSQAIITTNGSGGNLRLEPNTGGGNSGSITITEGANQNITVAPNGTGKIVLDNHQWPNVDGTNNQVLSTNGAGVLSWKTVNDLTAGVYLTQVQDDPAPVLGGELNTNGYKIKTNVTNGDVKIEANGTGNVELSGLAYPNADGSAGQVLKTNGSGSLDWVDKQDPTLVNDSQPTIQSTGQHWYRPVTGAFYTARNGNWDPINDDGYF